MKKGTKWFLGLSLTALAIGGGIYLYKINNKSVSDKLTEDDWKDLIDAAMANEKKSGKANAITTLVKQPIIAELSKQQFLKKGNRSQYDTIMTVIKSDKSDPDSVAKAQVAVLNYVNSLMPVKK